MMEEQKEDQQQQQVQPDLKIIEEKITKKNGEIVIKKYHRGKLLGSGGFAKCYEVTSLETKQSLAAKIIPKSTLTKSRQRQKLISEIKIHKSLHHSNVVQFEHVFEDHHNVYILLELCPYQTLNELIKRRKRITEYEAQIYIMQIVNSLIYLHQNKIIHRDLKLGNLFLGDKMTLKLGDFGLATRLENDQEKKTTICGTPNYIAPEILEGKEGHSYEVDTWSLGVIIYTLLIGKPPFETKDVKTTYKKIRQNNYCFPEHISISENAKSLIQSILNLNPQKRPTMQEILQHPFMEGVEKFPQTLPVYTLSVPYKEKIGNKHSQSQNNLKQNLLETAKLNTDMNNNGGGFMNNMRTQSIKNMPEGKNSNKFSQQQQNNNQNAILPASDTWVRQWVDYSNKYGLGYLLSNGCCGVFYNDCSKIILDQSSIFFEYYEKIPNQKQDKLTVYNINNYPQELNKKVTLLQHFRSYLESQYSDQNDGLIKFNLDQQKSDLVYVKKWMKTKNAIMFRLSNKIVQVVFSDKTEIILSSQNKLVTYVNKKGQRQNYQLSQALSQQDHEISKRLKYTKDILTQMLESGNKKQNKEKEILSNNYFNFSGQQSNVLNNKN